MKKRGNTYLCLILVLMILLSGYLINHIKMSPTSSSRLDTVNIQIEKVEMMYQQDTKSVELYPVIEVTASETIVEGFIDIKGIAGINDIEEKQLMYRPKLILQPDTTYAAIIKLKGKKDKTYYEETIEFTTKSLPQDQVWVEVALTDMGHRVYIRSYNEILKEMICSGGTEDEPTLFGTFYLQNRGSEFYSERFKEGALYWVRIKDQYLFHSVPRDQEGHIIQEEAELLGGPASHGCIRLEDEDAKWFYDNIPDGTMVIIHD